MEQFKRKRQEVLLKESRHRPTRSRFYLPEYLRLYSDEDVPTELEEPRESDEDDEPDDARMRDEDDKNANEHESLSGLDVEIESLKPENPDHHHHHHQTEQEQGKFQKLWAWITHKPTKK